MMCAGMLTAAATNASSGAQFHYIGPSFKQVSAITWKPLQDMARAVGGCTINQSQLKITYGTGATVELLGVENVDSIPVFKYIISSMSTPQNMHSRAKSL